MLVDGDFFFGVDDVEGTKARLSWRSSDEKALSSSSPSKSLLSVTLCDCWEIESACDGTLDATDCGDCRSDERAGKPKGREGGARVP